MRDCALWRRMEVMQYLGVGEWKLRALVESGALAARHFRFDRRGRPLDRACFNREEVERLVKEGGRGSGNVGR